MRTCYRLSKSLCKLKREMTFFTCIKLSRIARKSRPPICCILGHVDHGKSTLLDYLRKHEAKLKITESEFGGITQHVGSFEVHLKDSKERITFLDLPGHNSFEAMRSRGARLADIGILVVSADDGFKAQSKKSLEHLRTSNIPFIVAINKIDRPTANVDKIKSQLGENGVELEEQGGDIPCVEISALKGTNIDKLEENIIALSEILELKETSPTFEALVIEAKITKGLGSTVTMIPITGILKKSTILFCTESSTLVTCKVRTITDSMGKTVKLATPCTPVQVSGWKSMPPVGSKVIAVESESKAKSLFKNHSVILPSTPKGAIISTSANEAIPVIIRCDVVGSLEAIVEMVNNIKLHKYNAHISLLSAEIGNVTKKDIELATEMGGIILGFNVNKMESPIVIGSNIIYSLEDQLKTWIVDHKVPQQEISTRIGSAKVLQLFDYYFNKTPKRVLGCQVIDGLAQANVSVKVMRDKKLICTAKVEELKHFKTVVKKIESGQQCGILLSGCDLSIIKVNDDLIFNTVTLKKAEL